MHHVRHTRDQLHDLPNHNLLGHEVGLLRCHGRDGVLVRGRTCLHGSAVLVELILSVFDGCVGG